MFVQLTTVDHGSQLAERNASLLAERMTSYEKAFGYHGEWSALGGPAAKNPQNPSVQCNAICPLRPLGPELLSALHCAALQWATQERAVCLHLCNENKVTCSACIGQKTPLMAALSAY